MVGLKLVDWPALKVIVEVSKLITPAAVAPSLALIRKYFYLPTGKASNKDMFSITAPKKFDPFGCVVSYNE